jgi:hypothetical protein
MTIALTLQKYLAASVVATLAKTALFWFLVDLRHLGCQGATIQHRGGRALVGASRVMKTSLCS